MFVPYFGEESGKMYILKVYIYFPYINTQRRSTAPLNNTPIISPPHSEHLKAGLYQGWANHCEGDRYSDLNSMVSAILGNTLL